jgi:hypothetical protein
MLRLRQCFDGPLGLIVAVANQRCRLHVGKLAGPEIIDQFRRQAELPAEIRRPVAFSQRFFSQRFGRCRCCRRLPQRQRDETSDLA